MVNEQPNKIFFYDTRQITHKIVCNQQQKPKFQRYRGPNRGHRFWKAKISFSLTFCSQEKARAPIINGRAQQANVTPDLRQMWPAGRHQNYLMAPKTPFAKQVLHQISSAAGFRPIAFMAGAR
ncbi:hypothetical protein CDAR_447561 [Caerostris darwini]|uniref:Uncharacterized protein n=1 Tax=Caerostris darwini TaxID=1538125 RepID=A0AAV4PQD7_9ARAC|nr:hypothetical protein CDAR_447561 [Caerostris darwini]